MSTFRITPMRLRRYCGIKDFISFCCKIFEFNDRIAWRADLSVTVTPFLPAVEMEFIKLSNSLWCWIINFPIDIGWKEPRLFWRLSKITTNGPTSLSSYLEITFGAVNLAGRVCCTDVAFEQDWDNLFLLNIYLCNQMNTNFGLQSQGMYER